jgi:hypothetical protein
LDIEDLFKSYFNFHLAMAPFHSQGGAYEI